MSRQQIEVAEVDKYNAAALEILQREQIPVNDPVSVTHDSRVYSDRCEKSESSEEAIAIR